MLYYIGNKNTIALLQDEKGRFYRAAVNTGRNLVISRDRFPLIADYNIKPGIRVLDALEVHQHPGGGELWLYDRVRQGDVRTVGTDNPAFVYEPGWLSLCITAAGQERKEMCRACPAGTLPGWEWICHEDGTGHLRSFDNYRYFSYTLVPGSRTVNYQRPDRSSGCFEGDTDQAQALLQQFMDFAEQEARRAFNL